MINRTLYFGHPAYLKTANERLVIEMHDTGETKTAPIEDIGLLILDHVNSCHVDPPFLDVDPPRLSGASSAKQAIIVRAL